VRLVGGLRGGGMVVLRRGVGGEEGEGGVGEGAEMREMNGAVVNGGGHGMA
jgi:hypothetical protein